jgi:hypothetical protein
VTEVAYAVEYDVDAVTEMLRRLPSELRDKAMASAVNKTADKAKTEMKRQITAAYNVKSTEVGGVLHVTGAKWREPDKLSATLYPTTLGGRGRSMNVARFIAGKGAGDLLFEFKRNGAVKTIKPVEGGVSKPFVGNSGRTVFRRTGDARLPIEPVQVIDVPQMFNTKSINEAVLEKAREDLLVEVDRAVSYTLSTL